MWNTTKFEEHIKDRLKKELGGSKTNWMFSEYEVTRGKMVDNIFDEIKGIEPNLSDHGSNHIAKVLQNAHYLLSDNHKEHGLSAIDLYLLGMVILFHDVGNLFGRKDHHKKIGEIFDWARGTDPRIRHEKALVMTATRAHTSVALDGSTDTLKEVSETDHLYSEKVLLRDIAAILRFADELAEGPQRTSEFRRRQSLYEGDSQVYHDYASVTNIRADRGTERIQLTYEIEIDSDQNVSLEERSERLRRLLSFTYERAIKLDQERRYARFYCGALTSFKATHIAFNFHCGGNLLPLDLPTLRLDDKVIPGEFAKSIPEYDERYKVDSLVESLMSAIQQETST